MAHFDPVNEHVTRTETSLFASHRLPILQSMAELSLNFTDNGFYCFHSKGALNPSASDKMPADPLFEAFGETKARTDTGLVCEKHYGPCLGRFSEKQAMEAFGSCEMVYDDICGSRGSEDLLDLALTGRAVGGAWSDEGRTARTRRNLETRRPLERAI